MSKILLVEDNEIFADAVSDGLKAERFVVEIVHTGQEAIERLNLSSCDLAIIDWSLPDISGLSVVRELRAKGLSIPIIMLTGRNSVNDIAEGMDSGADDYVTKPFHMKELVARIHAALRRSNTAITKILQVGDLQMDPIKYIVTRRGVEIHISPTDFALLEFFMRNPGQVFSVQVLLSRVWHLDSGASSEGIRTAVRRLRKALDQEGEISVIENVARVGYRLRDQTKNVESCDHPS